VVFDAYAAGDHSKAKIIVYNQTPGDVQGLRARVRVYDIDGKIRDDRSASGIQVPFNGATEVMTLLRYPQISPVFFVRCQLIDDTGKLLAENTYWQSQIDDDLGAPGNDDSMDIKQVSWADMTPLNGMPRVQLEVSAKQSATGNEKRLAIRLHNPSGNVAFFERASISSVREGDEILPIQYDDNYVTVFPSETVEIHGTISKSANPRWIRIEGYNTSAISAQIM
jgi:exo-1,4-beta-D-glucosaminidase